MNANKFSEIVKISLQSTIWTAVYLIMTGTYAEHSYVFWIVFFSAIFIFNYPVVWVLIHYIVLPIMEKYKQKHI